MATQFDMNGQVAVITGGAQGIGKACAKRFLESGAKVAVWDPDTTLANNTVEELSGAGEIKAYDVDVTDVANVDDAVSQVITDMDRIDILVNNAAWPAPT